MASYYVPGGSASAAGTAYPFHVITGSNDTYYLDPKCIAALTISQVRGLRTTSGTITATFNINGTPITGLTNIAVTSTPQDVSATAANVMAAGDELSVTFASNSSAINVRFTLKGT